MATLANGSYYIFSAASPTRCLDVTANSAIDGANIELWDYNQTDAQVWNVVDAHGGTKRIINRLSGKSLDVDNATAEAGTNVQIWANTDPEWQGQLLTITDAETTATVQGESRDCFYISMSNATTLPFEAQGTGNWSNVELADKAASTSQYWCFVPVPAFRDGGIYEIAPALNYGLRLDVAGAGQTNGTNLQLYAANGTNAQKFLITQESTGYSLRSISSGKYIDVDGGVAAENQNCQIWDDNDTDAQRWNLISYGTTTIDGETVNCYRLGSYVDGVGTSYFMSVANAVGTSKANVQIHTLTSTPSDCLFALIPSWEIDPSMPVPYDLGCASAVLNTNRRVWAEQGVSFYPTWKCADAFVSAGPNHYEIRTRSRWMSSKTSTWSSWGAWSQWDTAATTEDGNQAWSMCSYSFSYLWSSTKSVQFQFQVRAVGVDSNNKQVIGQAATQTIDVWRTPSIIWTHAGWTPEGIRLGWSSDYRYGSTEFWLKSLGAKRPSEDAITPNILSTPRTIKGNTFSNSALIPNDDLTQWVHDGDSIYLHYDLGYDQAYPYKSYDQQVYVFADAGTTSVAPTFEWSGVVLVAFAPDLGTTRMWVRTEKQLFELEETSILTAPSGKKAFEVTYPMGEAFEVYTSSTNSSGTSWGTDVTAMAAIHKFFHAFTWIDEDGKTRRAYLEAFTPGGSNFQVTKNAVYQADVLDSRPYESVSSTDTVKTRLTISGILLDDLTTNVEDVRYMVNNHVRWRSPVHGNFADLYISDVTLTEYGNRTEISISAIKETI